MKAEWEQLQGQLEERFSELSANAALVENAVRMVGNWLSDPLCAAQHAPILAHVEHRQFSLLLDSFYQLIPFGTGGRRGRVGYGPNRINPATVAASVQGHCNYLKAKKPAAGRIVVAFDTRVFSDIAQTYAFLGPEHPLIGLSSRVLARSACEIYAGNGFEVYSRLVERDSRRVFLSTPELSFAIRRLEALGGMNVSASHNPPDDNGFKFFNEQGAQDVPPTDQELTDAMREIHEIRRIPFEDAVRQGLVRDIPPDLHASYLSTNLALRSKPDGRPVRVVFTPLCGTGDGTVGDVLRAAGHDVRIYGPQADFDGSFASVPFRLPNPEVPESASPALGLAKEVDAELVLCTDPDADRIGAYARRRDGRWRYLNGNEIASILAYYLVADKARGPGRSGFLIKTLVTSRMLGNIAAKGGCSIVPDLLVGFKYIAEVLLNLERNGRHGQIQASPGELVLAAEESHGVLLTPEIRDKDAAGGALILCELLSQLRAEDLYLTEYLDALSLECGNYRCVARSIVMRGIRGAELLSAMMQSLRQDPPSEFGGFPVLERGDFLISDGWPFSSETDRQARNLLVFRLDCAQIVIRPSGTEPKAKIYVDAEGGRAPGGSEGSKAIRFAQRLAAQVLEACIRRIGVQLSASASLLPDYIDLDLKADFGAGFRHDLVGAAGSLAEFDDSHRLQWLRQRLAPYAAGADALEATAPAVDHLCGAICSESVNPSVQQGVRALQRALAESRPARDWTT